MSKDKKEYGYFWSRCPYCNYRNSNRVKMVQYPTTHLVVCNMEEGGCDKKYAITITWSAKVEVASLQAEYYHQDFYAESKLFAEEKTEL